MGEMLQSQESNSTIAHKLANCHHNRKELLNKGASFLWLKVLQLL